MFLNGACGDVNPPTVSEGSIAALNHGKAIADKVRNMVWTKQNPDVIKITNSKLNFRIRENSGITSVGDGICRIITLALGNIAFVFLSLHLQHGFASAFQSIGARHNKYTPVIVAFGKWYSILIPAGFIIIAVYHFFVK